MSLEILTIVGARPQFIKAAAISRAIENYNFHCGGEGVSIFETILHTGQHYDDQLSSNFFEELKIPKPSVNLNVGSGNHGEQTAKMIAGIERQLLQQRPDCLLVYGDTNSTLAGAIAASKLHVPIAHVEAGLRSFNMRMPEEINRILTDRVSSRLYAPTQTAVDNLQNEGYNLADVSLVGDVTYDLATYYGSIVPPYRSEPFVLCTFHRPENTDNIARLTTIVDSLIRIAKDHKVIFPIHPRTESALKAAGLYNKLRDKVEIINPVGLIEMVSMQKAAALIMTDSGGIQKEAFFYETPCVTLRDQTEWTETVEAGCNWLTPPTSTENVLESVSQALSSKIDFSQRPYGDGTAAAKIISDLAIQYL